MLTLRPVFVGWINLLSQLPIQLFLTLWAAIFFGGMTSALPIFQGGAAWVPFVFFGAVAFVAVPLVTYVGKKLNYSRTEYRFLPDHLEFDEGFFATNRKEVKFEDVKEVTLHKGLLQRACDLGTIYLATTATGAMSRPNLLSAFGFGNVSASGIGVRDIRDPDAAFEKIRTLVNARRA